MLVLIPIIGPFLIFVSWAGILAIEAIFFFTGHPPFLSLTGNLVTLIGLVLIAVLF